MDTSIGHGADWRHGLVERIPRLADRLRNVGIERMDGVEFIHKHGNCPHALLYVDPPYAGTEGYEHDVDREALSAALLACDARVAVSGYGEEWDALGWHKETAMPANVNAEKVSGMRRDSLRMESLWMNFTPAQRRML